MPRSSVGRCEQKGAASVLSTPGAEATATVSSRRKFLLYLIKPSHYDDDGYVIQWVRSAIPSNSLAVLYGIAADCNDRRVLGPDVELDIVAIDETIWRVRPRRIIRAIRPTAGSAWSP